jgi:hypothetical protein
VELVQVVSKVALQGIAHGCIWKYLELYECWQKCVVSEGECFEATESKIFLVPADMRYGFCSGTFQSYHV